MFKDLENARAGRETEAQLGQYFIVQIGKLKLHACPKLYNWPREPGPWFLTLSTELATSAMFYHPQIPFSLTCLSIHSIFIDLSCLLTISRCCSFCLFEIRRHISMEHVKEEISFPNPDFRKVKWLLWAWGSHRGNTWHSGCASQIGTKSHRIRTGSA